MRRGYPLPLPGPGALGTVRPYLPESIQVHAALASTACVPGACTSSGATRLGPTAAPYAEGSAMCPHSFSLPNLPAADCPRFSRTDRSAMSLVLVF